MGSYPPGAWWWASRPATLARSRGAASAPLPVLRQEPGERFPASRRRAPPDPLPPDQPSSATGSSSRTTSTSPRPAASSSASDRVGVADQHDRQPLRVEVGARRGLDVGGRDRLDARPVPIQLVVRQPIRGEAAQGRHDRARRLEPQREDADQVVAGGPQLRVGHGAVSRIRRSSATRSRSAGTVASVLTAARAANGPAKRRKSKPALGAVRVALLLAQLHVQPRVEQAAEDHREHGDRVVVGAAPGQAHRPTRSSDCTEPGRWTRRTRGPPTAAATDGQPCGAAPRRPEVPEAAARPARPTSMPERSPPTISAARSKSARRR